MLAVKGIKPPVEHEEKFNTLLIKYFGFSLPKVTNAGQLAKELALRTRFLRDEVISVEMEQQQKGRGELYGFYETFRKFLIANLKEEDFADLFSQTITYGLFAARTRSADGFNRKLAYDLIPKTIGILRNVFRFISQGDLPPHMEVMVDDIAEVLNAADVKNILHQYYKAGKGEDPIVHFYETFLNEYDPATREKRGVYYTPEPVVRYIVRSVHELLKTHFRLSDGLSSKEVTLLDPAGGTLTFPVEAIKTAVNEYTGKYGTGGVNKLISGQILKNFYAFELMMAPYAIGHIKISFLLEELGYTMKEDERFKLYLTNTLDMEDLAQTQIPGLESLSDESHEAGKVKRSESILVIIGNPPYSGHSANKNKWTESLLKEDLDGTQNYYKVDGKPLGEKNPKWLQDDYVKFLRFAQWKIHKAGHGIVGMITNHSYLDNPTFRGMRQSLMNTFNEIYITDLHGNSLKKETAPDGGKDENVFDIMQGVSIALFVKELNKKGCKIYVDDLYGLREEKYRLLDKKEFTKKDYDNVKPEKPFYFLRKDNTHGLKGYLQWLNIKEIFPVSNTGIVTKRDGLTIAFDRTSLINRINTFRNTRISDEIIAQTFKLPFRDKDKWDLTASRISLKNIEDPDEWIRSITYRPFDKRFIFYHEKLVARLVNNVMSHMQHDNLGLTIGRNWSSVGSKNYDLVFCVNDLVDLNLYRRGGTILFPLYLYKTAQKKKNILQNYMLFEPEVSFGTNNRIPNIPPELLDQLKIVYSREPEPEQIFYYCYAVLFSNIYRKKYAEFLKVSLPHIPFTKDLELFKQMAKLGEQLKSNHLLEPKSLTKIVSKCFGTGDMNVDSPRYDIAEKHIYINETKYFDRVTEEVWNYTIGGYQVLRQYLKTRKGVAIEPSDFSKIISAITDTILLQPKTDKLFPDIEKDTINLSNLKP
jgi:predicted helicase